MPQQVRVNPVFGVPPTQIRPGTDASNAHLSHVTLHRFAIDRLIGPLTVQDCGDPS
jgi:hypothetical protein